MSQGANPWSDIGCREALRILGTDLVAAVQGDQAAREHVMWAATLAGIAFGNAGCHLPHGMSYAVSGLVKTKHEGEVESERLIVSGHGAVVAHNGTKVAVFRDETGQTWECSAVCTHMGCTVRWNDLERTWDCPCHGSRFDVQGRVLNGPASQDLAPAKVEKEA